ncbi:microsomal glutathione S-transferase 1-like [Bolinopsis microptera]|uniref:microsomal glutathione S-transferase 1-like n=1 Tax=Bolinopsis microptera TaxID=2820187 RepID=UPI00307AE0CB
MELTAELEAAVWYSTILLLKLATAGLLTASSRFRRNVFANEEDVVGNEGAQLKHTDVVVERYRRAHLNDMENIIPFIGLIFVYAISGAGDAGCVTLVSQIFTAARCIHTVVYIGQVRQPARALSFMVGMVCNVYMAVKVLLHLY